MKILKLSICDAKEDCLRMIEALLSAEPLFGVEMPNKAITQFHNN